MLDLKASELKLGDVVELFDGAFGTGVVTQIKDGLVHFFRPYAHVSNFSCTGGVIPYTGTENFARMARDEMYRVHYRQDIR